MSRRIVIGRRGNGDCGLFVAKPGYDAYTASPAQLLMNITSAVSQLILIGSVPSTQLVPLGLSRSPYVFVTSYNNLEAVPGHTWGPGPVRPSPIGPSFPVSTATINANGASMTINCSVRTVYTVYGKAFT